MSEATETVVVKFSLINPSSRIVYGVVYTPNMLDNYGGFAREEEVTRLAYRFMKLDLSKAIDTSHDNVPNGSVPVESFIARDNDPDFPAGAWVLGTKIVDDNLWEKIISGELNAYSMEIVTKRKLYNIKYYSFSSYVGETEEFDGHKHYYYLEINPEGRIIGGKTSVDSDHSHTITTNSITNPSDNHTHRIVIQNK